MKTTSVILITFLCLNFSCTKHPEESKPKYNSRIEIEDSILNTAKYVYIDSDSVLHVKLECGQPLSVINFDELKNKYSVRRISKNNVTYKELNRCCAVCISDERYEILKGKLDSITRLKYRGNNDTLCLFENGK